MSLGASVTLTWSVTKRADCTFPINVAGQTVGPTGSLAVKPLGTTTYLLAIAVPSRQKNLAQASVTVKLPPVVAIKGSTGDWANLLVQALGTEGTTVRLAEDVNLDLSYREFVTVAKGVTLTSEKCSPPRRPGAVNQCTPKVAGSATSSVPAGRDPQKLGPRIFTTTRPRPLFLIRCYPESGTVARVRLFGFRLHGPHFEMAEGDDNLERAIMVRACSGVEIANLEVAGWSGQGVYVVDDDFNGIAKPEDVWIHDNFFHHNQHKGGNGYGAETQVGAYALIERNVFDFNRHAIASSGKPNTGYDARYNLVLKGGGVHGTFFNPNTHQFDVHGTDSCAGHLNCGNAGERFWYRYNAFQFTRDNAIKIRGTPQYPTGRIEIENNVFAHERLMGGDTAYNNGAINLNSGRDRIYVGTGAKANTTGVDTFGHYGVCDFDGDGKDDLFQPTGVSWWYASAGRMHWVFLNAAAERLPQLAFGYFDGDRRCDVFTVRGNEFLISSGGSEPWKSLGSYGVPFDQLAFGNFVPEPAGAPPVTEIFRRAPNGQWYVVSPGKQDWRAVQSSSFPLDKLRFGDFTGDGVTDVLAVQGGRWSIAESATGSWARLNPKLSSELAGVRIADVDGNGKDDVLRLTDVKVGSVKWEVSWDGRSDWKPLATMSFEMPRTPGGVIRLFAFVGRFDDAAGADPMLVDNSRIGRIYSRAAGKVVAHGLYAY